MKKINLMLNEYAQSHQNRTNQFIHKICVPLIMLSLLGLMWSIPSGGINIAIIFSILALVYYAFLSFKYCLLMIPQLLVMILILSWLDRVGVLLQASVIVFIISWILQIWGHKIEGKKPSFLKDIFFLLIGPLWVTKAVLNIED
jgi:uncharacterized membrane protein YGL010W